MGAESIDDYQFSLGHGSQNIEPQITQQRSGQILIRDGDTDINSSIDQPLERP